MSNLKMIEDESELIRGLILSQAYYDYFDALAENSTESNADNLKHVSHEQEAGSEEATVLEDITFLLTDSHTRDIVERQLRPMIPALKLMTTVGH